MCACSLQWLAQHSIFLCCKYQIFFCRMDMVHLAGKGIGARRVPILLTPGIVLAMSTLVRTRIQCGIPTSNLYFFATPSENGYLNGWQAMKNVADSAELEKPELIHSTRLRKYIATVVFYMISGCIIKHLFITILLESVRLRSNKMRFVLVHVSCYTIEYIK